MSASNRLLIRVIIFVLSVALSGGYCYHRVDLIRAQYQNYKEKQNADSIRNYDYKSAFEKMADKNELFINLAVAVLGGVITLVIVAKVHPIVHIEWVYILLGPAASFLIGSLWSGVIFQSRLTYLTLKKIESFETLNELLMAQSDFLEYAIYILSIFGCIFLLNIVLGRVTPAHQAK